MRAEDLKILDDLYSKGSISEEEYAREKYRILNEPPAKPTVWGMDERTYLILMHLSQFVSYFLVPLVMWLSNNHNSNIDQHGKNIMNFTISYFIYSVISTILIVAVVGIFMLIALGIIMFVFIIIGAIKASNGEAWKYPLSIEFIK